MNLNGVRDFQILTTISNFDTSGVFTCFAGANTPSFSNSFLWIYVNGIQYYPLLYTSCLRIHLSYPNLQKLRNWIENPISLQFLFHRQKNLELTNDNCRNITDQSRSLSELTWYKPLILCCSSVGTKLALIYVVFLYFVKKN